MTEQRAERQTEQQQQDTVNQFSKALNVINAALAKHENEIPYKQLTKAADRILRDRKIGVGVYKDKASKPYDYFTVRFRDGSFELVAHGKEQPSLPWRVSRAYLDKVASNPDDYIDHPAKLDWDWLKSLVGLN